MQEEVSAVFEGYRAKTNPKIIVVSTPWKPIGFFYDIDNNPNSTFKKLYLDYTVGLGKIYNIEDIQKERSQPYFQREFMLAYSIGTGNVFPFFPDSNRLILKEYAKFAREFERENGRFPKTLIFAVNAMPHIIKKIHHESGLIW